MIRIVLIAVLAGFVVPSSAPADSDCYSCHGKKGRPGYVDKKSFEESVHGGFACARCHLNLPPYPHGKAARVSCGICHFLGADGAPRKQAREYKLSVHGKALASGNPAAPDCQTCHGSHAIYGTGDGRSNTRKQNIPRLCSQCHPREFTAYGASVHAKELLERNNREAPTCFDCHLEHLAPPTESEQWKLSLIKQCGNCHAGEMKTYRKTYHGKVTQLGYATPATCADCHGSHGIVRVTDDASPLSSRNILATCGKCHAGATAGFTRFYAHAEEGNRAKYPVLYYTYLFMTALLIGVFTFFFAHTFLWAYRALKERMQKKGGG